MNAFKLTRILGLPLRSISCYKGPTTGTNIFARRTSVILHEATPTTRPTRWQLHSVRSNSSDSKGSLVYTGPLTKAVRSLKIFSLITACCTVTFSPIIVYLGNPATPIVGRIAIASLVTTVGVSTTFILHWFVKSYVSNLYFNQATGRVTVETFSIFGRKKETSFHISEATPPDSVSAFSTFQGGGKSFFMHTELFEDPYLLRQLLGNYSTFEDNVK